MKTEPKPGEVRGCFRCGGSPGKGQGCSYCNGTGWLIWFGSPGNMSSRPWAAYYAQHGEFAPPPPYEGFIVGTDPHQPLAEPEPTPEEDAAIVELRTQIVGWLLAMSAEGTEPMVAAGMLLDVIVQMCKPAMGLGAIRSALLMTFEKTYDKPMSFIERSDAKELLDAVSNARRKIEGKPHLILPGVDT